MRALPLSPPLAGRASLMMSNALDEDIERASLSLPALDLRAPQALFMTCRLMAEFIARLCRLAGLLVFRTGSARSLLPHDQSDGRLREADESRTLVCMALCAPPPPAQVVGGALKCRSHESHLRRWIAGVGSPLVWRQRRRLSGVTTGQLWPTNRLEHANACSLASGKTKCCKTKRLVSRRLCEFNKAQAAFARPRGLAARNQQLGEAD